ncbi:uncharacterized protein LOC141606885 [Silene latifolia]|uniref:uncharacterized protein LOC141606885 n=1 Tax=Silene latifolia TaxID=37657 RepID=UPI003D77DA2B
MSIIVATLANNGALETVMNKAVPLAYAALSRRLLTNRGRRPYGSRSISTVSQPRLMPNNSPCIVRHPYSLISTSSSAFRNNVISRQFSTERIDPRFERRTGINMGIQFVEQQEALVIERFGKFTKILEPGLHFLVPIVDKIAYIHSLKEQMIEMQEHPAVTTDNVSIRVNAVLFVKVVDPLKASYGHDNVMYAVTQLAQTVMRSTIGKMPLDKTFMERENLNATIVNAINDVATQSGWGVVCCRHEIKDIIPPPGVKEHMSMQAEAERKKRAVFIDADEKKQAVTVAADANKEALILTSEAEKIDIILKSEAEKTAIINRGEGEKQATSLNSEAALINSINRAKGEAEAKRIMAAAEAEAIRTISEAAKIDSINRAKGEAEAIRIIAESIQKNRGQEAVSLKLAQDYVQAFSKVAQKSTTMLLPAAMGDPSSMISSALALYKNIIVDKQHSNNHNLQETLADSATEIEPEPEALGSPKNIAVDKQHNGNNNNLQETSTVVDSKFGALDLEAQRRSE